MRKAISSPTHSNNRRGIPDEIAKMRQKLMAKVRTKFIPYETH